MSSILQKNENLDLHELNRQIKLLMASIDNNIPLTPVPERLTQLLMATSVKLLVHKIEAGENLTAFSPQDQVTATEVAKAVMKLLDAADIELFELAMWQGWGATQ